MIGVAVRVDAFEVRSEAQLDDLELRELGEDAVEVGPTRNPFALVRPNEDSARSRLSLTIHFELALGAKPSRAVRDAA